MVNLKHVAMLRQLQMVALMDAYYYQAPNLDSRNQLMDYFLCFQRILLHMLSSLLYCSFNYSQFTNNNCSLVHSSYTKYRWLFLRVICRFTVLLGGHCPNHAFQTPRLLQHQRLQPKSRTNPS